jgi:hypothetical protein
VRIVKEQQPAQEGQYNIVVDKHLRLCTAKNSYYKACSPRLYRAVSIPCRLIVVNNGQPVTRVEPHLAPIGTLRIRIQNESIRTKWILSFRLDTQGGDNFPEVAMAERANQENGLIKVPVENPSISFYRAVMIKSCVTAFSQLVFKSCTLYSLLNFNILCVALLVTFSFLLLSSSLSLGPIILAIS